MTKCSKQVSRIAGLDLGDRKTHVVILDAETGDVVEEFPVRTCESALRRRFAESARMRIALEAGTHSAWVSRRLQEWGHEVVVANPRKTRLIYQNPRKDDRIDAMYLARLVRVDPELLSPIQHRTTRAQADLARVRARDQLVQTRTQLINHCRGVTKSLGDRLPSCSSPVFAVRAAESMPEILRPALEPLLACIQLLTEQIRLMERELEIVARQRYPETKLLRSVAGVGPVTSLVFRLVIEDPRRFAKSRDVGAYVGLVPRRDQSGNSNPQLGITRTGDRLLRQLLVGCSYYILGPFGKDSALRRYGQRLAQRGGKAARKRAAVAVARKLAVLLHRLWLRGEVYEPFHGMAPEAST